MEEKEVICLSSDDEDSLSQTSKKSKQFRVEVKYPSSTKKNWKRKVEIGFSKENDAGAAKKLRVITNDTIGEISIVLPDSSSGEETRSNLKSKIYTNNATSDGISKNLQKYASAKNLAKFNFESIKKTKILKVAGEPERLSAMGNTRKLNDENQNKHEKSNDLGSSCSKAIQYDDAIVPLKNNSSDLQDRDTLRNCKEDGNMSRKELEEQNVTSKYFRNDKTANTVKLNEVSRSLPIKRIQTTHTPFIQKPQKEKTFEKDLSPEVEIVSTILTSNKDSAKRINKVSGRSNENVARSQNNRVTSSSKRNRSESSDSETSVTSESSKQSSNINTSKTKSPTSSISLLQAAEKLNNNLSTTKSIVNVEKTPKKLSLSLKPTEKKSPLTKVNEIAGCSKSSDKASENEVNSERSESCSESKDEMKSSKSSEESPKKPQLIEKTRKPVEPDSKSTFVMFLSLCLQTKRCEEMEKIVTRLKRHYDQLDPKYARSKEFNDLLNSTREKIMNNNKVVYHYIGIVFEEMKPRRVQGESSKLKEKTTEEVKDEDETGERNEPVDEEIEDDSPEARRLKKKIKMINHAMKKCARSIEKLELAEVDFDEDNDSNYIKLSRYKEKMIELYRKLCEYTNEHADAGRAYLRPKLLRVTQIPSIDQAINSFINSKLSYNNSKTMRGKSFVDGLIFPDYVDILECVGKVNEEQNLGLDKRRQQKLAQDAFTQLGKHLQKARQNDYWDTFSFHLENTKDPASADPELSKKLKENQEIAEKNTKAVFEKYVKKQEEQGSRDSGSDVTEDESDEDDDDKDDENDSNSVSTAQSSNSQIPLNSSESKNDSSSSGKNKENQGTEDPSNSSPRNVNDRIPDGEVENLAKEDVTEPEKGQTEEVTKKDESTKDNGPTPSNIIQKNVETDNSAETENQNDNSKQEATISGEKENSQAKDPECNPPSLLKVTLREVIDDDLFIMDHVGPNKKTTKLKKIPTEKKTEKIPEENPLKTKEKYPEDIVTLDGDKNELADEGVKDAEAVTEGASDTAIDPPRPLRIRSFAKPPSSWSSSQETNPENSEIVEIEMAEKSEDLIISPIDKSKENEKRVAGSIFRNLGNVVTEEKNGQVNSISSKTGLDCRKIELAEKVPNSSEKDSHPSNRLINIIATKPPNIFQHTSAFTKTSKPIPVSKSINIPAVTTLAPVSDTPTTNAARILQQLAASTKTSKPIPVSKSINAPTVTMFSPVPNTPKTHAPTISQQLSAIAKTSKPIPVSKTINLQGVTTFVPVSNTPSMNSTTFIRAPPVSGKSSQFIPVSKSINVLGAKTSVPVSNTPTMNSTTFIRAPSASAKTSKFVPVSNSINMPAVTTFVRGNPQRTSTQVKESLPVHPLKNVQVIKQPTNTVMTKSFQGPKVSSTPASSVIPQKNQMTPYALSTDGILPKRGGTVATSATSNESSSSLQRPGTNKIVHVKLPRLLNSASVNLVRFSGPRNPVNEQNSAPKTRPQLHPVDSSSKGQVVSAKKPHIVKIGKTTYRLIGTASENVKNVQTSQRDPGTACTDG